VIIRNQLTCERTACGRTFSAVRNDARFCTRACRRAKSPPAPPVEAVSMALDTREEGPEVVEEEDLHGWRRMGGFLVPPADPRNIVHIDGWPR
jgi:hypothetical protein